jgi:hypothetical protein
MGVGGSIHVCKRKSLLEDSDAKAWVVKHSLAHVMVEEAHRVAVVALSSSALYLRCCVWCARFFHFNKP